MSPNFSPLYCYLLNDIYIYIYTCIKDFLGWLVSIGLAGLSSAQSLDFVLDINIRLIPVNE